MIICGFPGVGKSSICRTIPNYVDLESTPFKKNWELYADVIEHMEKNHYNVFVSSHIQLRKELRKRKINYIFVVPEEDLKDVYIERYKNRGNSESFIKQISDNWNSYVRAMDDKEIVYRLGADDFLLDALPRLNIMDREQMKEDVGGGVSATNVSSNFSGFVPEKMIGMVDLIDHEAVDSLKKEPQPLPEKVFNRIEDITIDDLCED